MQQFSYFDAGSGSSDLYTDLKYGNNNVNETEDENEDEDGEGNDELEELRLEIHTVHRSLNYIN